MSDFGKGDALVIDDVLFKTLQWHGLLEVGGSGIPTASNIDSDKRRLGNSDSEKSGKSSESK